MELLTSMLAILGAVALAGAVVAGLWLLHYGLVIRPIERAVEEAEHLSFVATSAMERALSKRLDRLGLRIADLDAELWKLGRRVTDGTKAVSGGPGESSGEAGDTDGRDGEENGGDT